MMDDYRSISTFLTRLFQRVAAASTGPVNLPLFR